MVDIKGTALPDAMDATSAGVYLGLQGGDTISHNFSGNTLYFIGGSGSDQYGFSVANAAMIVQELSGSADEMLINGMMLNSSNTYFATILGKHLWVQDYAAKQAILLIDWAVPAHQIESFIFSDGTYTYQQLASVVGTASPQNLGNFATWEAAAAANVWVLPPGATGADQEAAFSQYRALSIQDENPVFAWTNTQTNANGTTAAPTYSGPVAYVDLQYLGASGGEAVRGTAFCDFINTLAGDDAVDGGLGDDVIDGGTGSNFLTGGAGVDVFFLDGRGGATTWSTITDWHAGEQLSVWGWQPGVSRVIWQDNAGAPGWTGVTMHGDLNGDGTIDTSVTWTGMTKAQLPVPHEFDGLLWFIG